MRACKKPSSVAAPFGAVLIAHAGETRLANYLSLTVLAGLVLNAAFDWWWSDRAAALVVAGFAAWSSWAAWHEAGEH